MFLVLVAAAFSLAPAARGQARGEGPVRPALESTSHRHDRGTDVVEPVPVYLVSIFTDGRTDSTALGLAKVPDPRRQEIGAFVKSDLETGTLIRLGGAQLFDANGLTQHVTFGDKPAMQRLVFIPGRHDDVVSLQGVEPIARRVGEEVVFDVEALYDAAAVNPLSGRTSHSGATSARTALLRMASTYAGGEVVDLSIVLVPHRRVVAALQPIQVVQRDTTVLHASFNYEIKQEIGRERTWTAAAAVESGMGQSHLRTDIPATLRPAISSSGTAGVFYVLGDVVFRRDENRWGFKLFGVSAVTITDFRETDHHQVGLYADARFEHGTAGYFVVQLSGEMTDKQYQVFDWNSADYSGSMSMGFGHAGVSRRGWEQTRVEFLAGIRMGENRRIEMLETRGRSRGLGPQAGVEARLVLGFWENYRLRTGSALRGYSIVGRGHRDRGFSERGLLMRGEFQLGREVVGVVPYVGVTGMWIVKEARFKEGSRYYENKLVLAPGMTLTMHL